MINVTSEMDLVGEEHSKKYYFIYVESLLRNLYSENSPQLVG